MLKWNYHIDIEEFRATQNYNSTLKTDNQQQKAKMPAAGATQALRLFCNPLCVMQ